MAPGKHGNVHNSISGLELRKKILHDVEVLLDGDDRFRHHVAYPRVSYTFAISLSVYPAEPSAIDLTTRGEAGDLSIVSENPALIEVVELSSEHEHQHPDRVRREIGAPVPKPVEIAGMGTFDLTKDQNVQQDETLNARKVTEEIMADTVAAGKTNTGTTDIQPQHTMVAEVDGEPSRTVPTSAANPGPLPRELSHVQVGGHGGVARTERVEIPGHAVSRPLIIPREPANGRVSIANEASMDGAFGVPLEVEIVPKGERGDV